MKKLAPLALLFIYGCANPIQEKTTKTSSPKPGIIIAADSMPLPNDELNHRQFAVKIFTTDSLGVYDVEANWGHNLAVTTLAMPHGGEDFKPLVRRGDSACTYIVGFHFNDDTIFHDYYQIKATSGQINMKYIKAYYY